MDIQALQPLCNPLATIEQLSQSASALDGLSGDLVDSIRYQGCLLTQSAGILLRQPQDVVAAAIVTFTRFYAGPEGGSFRVHAAKDISAAALYLTAKSSASPVSPRSLLNVYAYLLSSHSTLNPAGLGPDPKDPAPADPTSYTLSAGGYQTALVALQRNETLVLRTLSFRTRPVLPHGLALTYLSTLGAVPAGRPTERSCALAGRTLALLNSALLSPQLLYLTHQPHALAVAAIYLAARQTATRLVGEGEGDDAAAGWWEVFDVGREELGFVVVAMLSLDGWARRERQEGRGLGKGSGGRWLLSLEDVEREIEAS